MDVLIVKRGRKFEGFTLEGQRVLAWAQQMMEDCTRLKHELHGLRDHGMQGPFRMGILPATSALASVLSVAFAEKFPKLEISIETGDSTHLLQALRQGALDVMLSYLEDPFGEGLDAYTLYRERMFFFTREDIAGNRVKWEDVKSLPLCLLRAAVPRAAEVQLAKAGRVVYSDSAAVLAAYMETGRWSTILPQSLATMLPQSAGLRALGLTTPHWHANVGFIVIESDPLPAPVHALMEMAHTPELVRAIRRILAAYEAYLPRTSEKMIATEH